MALTESTDFVTRALAKLPEQFKGRVKFAAFLSSFIEQAQDVEAVLFEIVNETHLETAVGESLNVLGRIVGEDRQGLDDDAYRLRIKARIRLNLSSGTVEDILEILALVLGSSYVSELQAYAPASFRLDIYGPMDTPTSEYIAQIVSEARAAGVGGLLVYSEELDAVTFTFADGDTATVDAVRGWADDASAAGGYWADALEA